MYNRNMERIREITNEEAKVYKYFLDALWGLRIPLPFVLDIEVINGSLDDEYKYYLRRLS